MASAPVTRPFHLLDADDEDDLLEDEEFEDEKDDQATDEEEGEEDEDDEDDENGDDETWYVRPDGAPGNLTSTTEVPTLPASCLKILGSS